MKEKGPIRKTVETAGKAWTYASIPIEIYLLAHGIITSNSLEILFGTGGLVADIFLLKWLKRNEKKSVSKIPPSLPRGSQRFSFA